MTVTIIEDRVSGKKIAYGSASITGTGNITTGLTSIESATVSVANSGTSIPTDSASITSTSGGTISVVVTKHDSSANSVETSAKTVNFIAIGY